MSTHSRGTRFTHSGTAAPVSQYRRIGDDKLTSKKGTDRAESVAHLAG